MTSSIAYRTTPVLKPTRFSSSPIDHLPWFGGYTLPGTLFERHKKQTSGSNNGTPGSMDHTNGSGNLAAPLVGLQQTLIGSDEPPVHFRSSRLAGPATVHAFLSVHDQFRIRSVWLNFRRRGEIIW